MDLHFADEAWWRPAIDESTSDMHLHELDSTNRLQRELSERLAHETLMFAWQMARTDRTATQVLFATRSSAAEMIGALTPGQVRDIALRRSGGIQVRCDEDDCFWRDMLLAAKAGNEAVTANLHLHAKLLLLAPLVRSSLQPIVRDEVRHSIDLADCARPLHCFEGFRGRR